MRNLLFFVVLGAFGAVACTKPNPNRCCTDPADCQANDIPVGSTCSDGLVCRGNQCIAETCSSSTACESMAPYCVAGLCGASCTADTQCPGAAQDPSERFCVSGQCVACRTGMNDCPTSAPVCDMGTCRACTLDSDCPSTVCDVDTGACVDPSAIRYAAPDGVDTNPCTQSAPCTVAHAISIADVQRPWVRLLPGTYSGGFSVATGSVNIVGTGATVSDTINVTSADVTANIRGVTSAIPVTLTMRAVLCSPSSGTAALTLRDFVAPTEDLQMGNCTVTLRGSRFAQLLPTGNSTLTIDRSVVSNISNSSQPGTHLGITATNSVFGQLDLSVSSGSATAMFAYNTFYLADSSGNPLVDCTTSQTASLVYVDNVFYDPKTTDDAIKGTNCTFDNNVAYPQVDQLPGTTTIIADPKLVDPANGDFHLQAGSPAIDAAKPTAVDPSVDYDGTARPQGVRRDIGAFEYKP